MKKVRNPVGHKDMKYTSYKAYHECPACLGYWTECPICDGTGTVSEQFYSQTIDDTTVVEKITN